MEQPLKFECSTNPKHIFKLNKVLCGLKQAPKYWYELVSSFLTQNDFSRSKINTTLFRKNLDNDFIIIEIYADHIIFGATNKSFCRKFSKILQNNFEMSMMGELKFFLGL